MKQNRRLMLRMLLLSPLAALGLNTGAKAEIESPGRVTVRPHCGICDHYVPPRRLGHMLDGPPSAYCRHRVNLRGYYETEELIYELKLGRMPTDQCELFSVRKEFR